MNLEPATNSTANARRRAPSTSSGELNLKPVSEMQPSFVRARSQEFESPKRTVPMRQVGEKVTAVATREDWATRAGDISTVESVTESEAVEEVQESSESEATADEVDEWGDLNEEEGFLGSIPPVSSAEEPVLEPANEPVDEWAEVNDEEVFLGSAPSTPSTQDSVDVPVTVPTTNESLEDDDGWGAVNDDLTPMLASPELTDVPKDNRTSSSAGISPKPSRVKSPRVQPESRTAKPKPQPQPVPRKKASNTARSQPILQPADLKVLRALVRLRFGSVEHIRSLLLNTNAQGINTSHKSLYTRLRRLASARTPYVENRPGVHLSGNSPDIWAVTEYGIQVSDGEAYGYVPPLKLDTNKFETSVAHLAIAASYVSTLDASRYLAIPDVVLQKRIASALVEGAYYPAWDTVMDPYGEAEQLGIYVAGRRYPHEPDLVVLEEYEGEHGDIERRISHAVEVETSVKDQAKYEELLAGYKAAEIPCLYLIHNTALPGSTSRAGIQRIYNTVRRAAANVWLVADEDVDNIIGFEARIVPDEWKTTDPEGRMRAEREARGG